MPAVGRIRSVLPNERQDGDHRGPFNWLVWLKLDGAGLDWLYFIYQGHPFFQKDANDDDLQHAG